MWILCLTVSTRLGIHDPALQPFSEELDDNNNLDFDFGSDCDDSVIGGVPEGLLDVPWSSQDCSEQELLTACVDAVDPASRALNAFEVKRHQLKLSVCEMYRRIRQEDLANGTRIRAHVDGGSMATTTDDASLLWHFKAFSTSTRVPALKVADDYSHYPTGAGYLRAPYS